MPRAKQAIWEVLAKKERGGVEISDVAVLYVLVYTNYKASCEE
jgi:hypothetical protein